jgi:Protein of unknown function (DUF1573)
MSIGQATHKRVVKSSARPARCFLIMLLGSTSMFVILAAWALVSFGSVRNAVGYYFRGETLFADATEKSVGVTPAGAEVLVSFTLTNYGTGAVRVVGCDVYCNCTVPKDLPFEIRPNERKEFTVQVEMSRPESARGRKSQELKLPLVLFTSNPSQSRLPLWINGEVRYNMSSSSDPER